MVNQKNFTQELQNKLPDTVTLDWEKAPDVYFPKSSCKLIAFDKSRPDNKFIVNFNDGLGEDLIESEVCSLAQSIIDGLKRS